MSSRPVRRSHSMLGLTEIGSNTGALENPRLFSSGRQSRRSAWPSRLRQSSTQHLNRGSVEYNNLALPQVYQARTLPRMKLLVHGFAGCARHAGKLALEDSDMRRLHLRRAIRRR
jgi:hypothetical protein